MTGVKSVFSLEEQSFMENTMGLHLSDTKDYSDDELLEIYDRITENLPHDYDEDGTPSKNGRLFESIIDKFIDNLNN